jgi:hypothetical protein
MMHKIAIGLAAATLAIGSPALSASAPQSQNMESGISKDSASPTAKSQRSGPRTYGSYDEERGRSERLSPAEREGLRMIARQRYAEHINELTPRRRERLSTIARERYTAATPLQRERVRRFAHERYAELTPLEREQIRRMVGERYAELTPFERWQLHRFVREHYRGPYGRAER